MEQSIRLSGSIEYWKFCDLSDFLLCRAAPKQGVALTGRNRTVPPCSVGRRTGHAPGPAAAHERYRRRQTTPTDDSVQKNTSPLGGPVISDDI